MTTRFRQGRSPPDSKLPENVAAALDASAEDLRHDRVEDAESFLQRVHSKVDAYKAGRSTRPDCTGKG